MFTFLKLEEKSFLFKDNIIIRGAIDSTLRNYWSKLEIFSLTGKVLYFDLDVIITGSINKLVDQINNLQGNKTFYMLKAFNPNREFNSSIMGWNGDFKNILSNATSEILEMYSKWDQQYISDFLKQNGVTIKSVNDCLNIKSYKHHCRENVPGGTDVIVFHGMPRPKDVNWLEGELVS
jgi:hypothetical protein